MLVTKADGTTELKTLGQLGITEITLISNNQDITLGDGSQVLGAATYTRSNGTTGVVADTRLKYEDAGYVVSKTVTLNGDGSTTIVNAASNADGSLANKTTSNINASGSTRTVNAARAVVRRHRLGLRPIRTEARDISGQHVHDAVTIEIPLGRHLKTITALVKRGLFSLVACEHLSAHIV